jgi:hypothetical protein
MEVYEIKIQAGAGQRIELEPSPEMERVRQAMIDFDKANPDFWCKCGKPEAGNIVPRGHSVDVDCKNCGGWIQIG